MTYKITKYTKKASRFGGYYIRTEFLGSDNKRYYTCLDPRKKNFIRWNRVLEVGTVLKNLKVKSGNLIDADSRFEKVGD